MFTYNENLVLEDNEELLALIKTISVDDLKNTILQVVNREITLELLKNEFDNGLKFFSPICGEHIRNFFSITLNGVEKAWFSILENYQSVIESLEYPLYENILEYLEELLDEIDFDFKFKKELNLLNS